MNKLIISACILGVTSLVWSTGTFADSYDLVRTTWDGTTTVVNGVTEPLGVVIPGAKKHHRMYLVTDENTGSTKLVRGLCTRDSTMTPDMNSCMNTVFPGICHGVKYTITDEKTGKQYTVMGVKEGTMDVMHGTKMIRYQYVVPIVKAM